MVEVVAAAEELALESTIASLEEISTATMRSLRNTTHNSVSSQTMTRTSFGRP